MQSPFPLKVSFMCVQPFMYAISVARVALFKLKTNPYSDRRHKYAPINVIFVTVNFILFVDEEGIYKNHMLVTCHNYLSGKEADRIYNR